MQIEEYQRWLDNPNVENYLKEELKEMKSDDILDAFHGNIEFGTAGMRGIMSPGTNRINIHTIRKATKGLAIYLKNKKKDKVAIAYDNRLHSKEFAYDCAKMLNQDNIHVYLFDSLRPTPELSFAVRYYKCDAGIMITASHNPKQYNGYKVYDENGCQLIPLLANELSEIIAKIPNMLELKPAIVEDNQYLHIINKEVDEAYYEKVLSIRLRPDVDKDFNIAFSPEQGASAIPVMETLQRAGYKVIAVESQIKPDPFFSGTKSPNPEVKEAYEGVIQTATKNNAELILVCDPDGDRMGVGVLDHGEYKLLNGNESGAILLEYILSTRQELRLMPAKPTMYNTIVTSDIGEAIATKYGVEVIKTLTGFKYIGNEIQQALLKHNHDYVFGYEESYGSLIAPFVRDKDATQACLLLAEAAAYYRQKQLTLYDLLFKIFEETGAFADGQMSIALDGADGANRLQKIMADFRNNPLTQVDKYKVYKIEDYKLKKIYEDKNVKELNGFDQSDVLKYFLEDGSFICIRPSGTEPKCKLYFSAKAESYDLALAKIDIFKRFIKTKIIG